MSLAITENFDELLIMVVDVRWCDVSSHNKKVRKTY